VFQRGWLQGCWASTRPRRYRAACCRSSADPVIKQIGFALAFGILMDAFLVRMTLVPAVLAIFGDRAW
jgi:uncharacterized membrane protein YdfJ with MMPL/SSD domain